MDGPGRLLGSRQAVAGPSDKDAEIEADNVDELTTWAHAKTLLDGSRLGDRERRVLEKVDLDLEFRYQFDPWWHDNKTPAEMHDEFKLLENKWLSILAKYVLLWHLQVWTSNILPPRRRFFVNEMEERKQDEEERMTFARHYVDCFGRIQVSLRTPRSI
jgi:hypothetical protein